VQDPVQHLHSRSTQRIAGEGEDAADGRTPLPLRIFAYLPERVAKRARPSLADAVVGQLDGAHRPRRAQGGGDGAGGGIREEVGGQVQRGERRVACADDVAGAVTRQGAEQAVEGWRGQIRCGAQRHANRLNACRVNTDASIRYLRKVRFNLTCWCSQSGSGTVVRDPIAVEIQPLDRFVRREALRSADTFTGVIFSRTVYTASHAWGGYGMYVSDARCTGVCDAISGERQLAQKLAPLKQRRGPARALTRNAIVRERKHAKRVTCARLQDCTRAVVADAIVHHLDSFEPAGPC